MAITDGTERADRAVGSRVGAVVVALWWAGLFFGIIDLLVGIIRPMFPDDMTGLPVLVVSTSWGLLFTVLVPVPLIAWAVRPTGWVGPQVVAVAAAVLVAGLAAVAVGQICRGAPRGGVRGFPADVASEARVVHAPIGCDPRVLAC